jgi:aminopeptidase N
MMFLRTAPVMMIAGLMMGACARTTPQAPLRPSVPSDPASYANVAAFVTTHLALDLTADFEARTLSGTATLAFERRDPAAPEVVLDTRDLHIRKVETAISSDEWRVTTFTLAAATPAFGSALHIAMPQGADRVRVTYATSPGAKGLQWLTPTQTAGKKQPFLFSQAQTIQARSFIPLQDLPGIRLTYDAVIHTPKGLVAVMGAEMTTTPEQAGRGAYTFHMPQPIPSYLIALAVGDLAFKPMGTRTGVWAEPSVLDRAAREFDDTEQMITATEKVYGPYRWGRYDLLVLPASFPFGGMENPRLTFVTPTVIAGDKSLVSLVAHELAHSWSGNLVTNATWADFWLNEGFTTYLERRIVEAIYGKPRADMEAMLGFKDLADSRSTLAAGPDRTLLPNLAGRDPDEGISSVPYEQGALFLLFLEAKFGRASLDGFLRQWFDGHAFSSATTDLFLVYLRTHLTDAKPGVVTEPQIQEWLHSETVPAFAVLARSDAFVKVEQARDAWLGGHPIAGLAKSAAAWSTQEWVHFVGALPRKMEGARLAALDGQFGLTSSQNAEIAHVWFRLAIANHYAPAYRAMAEYMTRIGRQRLVVPLYRDLAATPEGLTLANTIFAGARDGYHPVTQDTIASVLKR